MIYTRLEYMPETLSSPYFDRLHLKTSTWEVQAEAGTDLVLAIEEGTLAAVHTVAVRMTADQDTHLGPVEGAAGTVAAAHIGAAAAGHTGPVVGLVVAGSHLVEGAVDLEGRQPWIASRPSYRSLGQSHLRSILSSIGPE